MKQFPWLVGFKPFEQLPEHVIDQGEQLIFKMGKIQYESLICTPGTKNYIPPYVPADESWLENAHKMVALSFQHLIADIWTQLLVLKRDAKEKPLYLLWDHEIPKPTPLTALAWLLTCETWVLPNHKELDDNKYLDQMFPPQTFMLPHSQPLSMAGTRPSHFAAGDAPVPHRSLGSKMNQSLHRGDREKMANYDRAVFHRPQTTSHTSYIDHVKPDHYHTSWTWKGGWPIGIDAQVLDHGIAVHELSESFWHINTLARLRRQLMNSLICVPGLPTYYSNFLVPGGWIRHWSEVGLIVSTDKVTRLHWSPDHDAVGLESGLRLKTVPIAAPCVWFGWSEVGQKFEGSQRIITASESWANAYLAHRTTALQMLFKPYLANVAEMISNAEAIRGQVMKKAARLKASTEAKPNGFAAAFAKAFEAKEE